VAEVATYCEYQIKVKEQEFLDRMKEVTDACNHQLEESQLKMEASLQERVEKVVL
jgi:predicted HicB family RNase H-like nuclease